MEVFGIMGFTFGFTGFVFGMNAMARIARLEKQLKDAGTNGDATT